MLEQFMKLTPAQKAGVLAGALALVYGGGYFLLVDPEITRGDQATGELRKLEGELQALAAVAKHDDLVKLRKVKDDLVEKDKENRKLLPTNDEVPDFIEQVEVDARDMGLKVRRFERLKTKQRSMVHAIPVKVEVRGSMIDFIKFLRIYASSSRRIIHLKKLRLQIVQPELGKLTKELRASRPITEQKQEAKTPAEWQLERIQVAELARKRTQVVATFTAYAFIWTGKEPENPEPEDQEGKRKRT